MPREAGLAPFGAFASRQKTLHADAGRHTAHPRSEADGAARRFARHLPRSVPSPALN
ncbi:glycoside hydrolase family 25 domain-containing protein [Streptomyces shenzhenensis]|uniref:hypothetical protein n=1 Tax=Streptomyces shenzhenensis TaxID=943815 RepID=UPI0015F060AB|nr:hypothetical protein [Streptomyces shenzhenensis]